MKEKHTPFPSWGISPVEKLRINCLSIMADTCGEKNQKQEIKIQYVFCQKERKRKGTLFQRDDLRKFIKLFFLKTTKMRKKIFPYGGGKLEMIFKVDVSKSLEFVLVHQSSSRVLIFL